MNRLIESISTPLQVRSARRLTGPFAVLDEFNQNGRVYPESVYLPAFRDLLTKIKERRLLGELDHPLEYDEIRLSNVSHVIVESHVKEGQNGKKVIYGTVELLDTPAGKIAQALVSVGVPLGISSRAVGNTKRVSEGVEVTQLKLITYDLVADPSFNIAVLSEEKRSELSESLNNIESRLPLNESDHSDDTIREKIRQLRESLCNTETKSEAENNINEGTDLKTLEIVALKKLVSSKNSVIKSDTAVLVESRNTIKDLNSKLTSLQSRYDGLMANHQKLQDSYNQMKSSHKLEESKRVAELSKEVLELRKRLAVEQRGMSYDSVQKLLESAQTEQEISRTLDSLSSIGKRSNTVSSQEIQQINESLSNASSQTKLSTLISRV